MFFKYTVVILMLILMCSTSFCFAQNDCDMSQYLEQVVVIKSVNGYKSLENYSRIMLKKCSGYLNKYDYALVCSYISDAAFIQKKLKDSIEFADMCIENYYLRIDCHINTTYASWHLKKNDEYKLKFKILSSLYDQYYDGNFNKNSHIRKLFKISEESYMDLKNKIK